MTTDQPEHDDQPIYDLLTDLPLGLKSLVAPATLPGPTDGQPEDWLRVNDDFKGYAVTLAREYLAIRSH